MYRFYVEKNGCDCNSGTSDKPFQTIEKAQEAVRHIISAGLDAPVKVTVREGEYRTDGITFGAADSGTKECPITYEAEGKVVINGGITMQASDFVSLNEEEKARLHGAASEKVVKADLKKYGLTREDWGEICAVGSHSTAYKYDDAVTSPLHCELFVNDERMIMARYPNDGFLYTEEPIREGNSLLWDSEEWKVLRNPNSDIRRIDSETNERVKNWKSQKDVWIFGYPKWGWADDTTPIVRIDTDECTLESKYASLFGIREHAPYYFFNVFEELDAPGEWYMDRENGIIYLYPPQNLEKAVINLSITTKDLLKIGGATDVTIKGFTFTTTRGNAVDINGDRNIIDMCEIKNVAGIGIKVQGNYCIVSNSLIHHTGFGGVMISGGDRNTLTSSGNIVTNNHIHHFAEICRTYQSGVKAEGVNCIVSHNLIHDAPHMAIGFKGNEHIIEYNEICDVCQLGDDSAAIYYGRDYTDCGNIIRYNYFHDISSKADKQWNGTFAIYCDDNPGGASIYGNVMHRCQSALLFHGGHDMIFKNNLIIDACNNSWQCFEFCDYMHWRELGPNGHHAEDMQKVQWENDIWKEKYPRLAEYLTWDPETEQSKPHYCDISNNVIINHKRIVISRFNCFDGRLHNRIMNNIEIADREFAGIPKGDRLDLSGNRLAEILPGFEEIPFDKMGLTEKTMFSND